MAVGGSRRTLSQGFMGICRPWEVAYRPRWAWALQKGFPPLAKKLWPSKFLWHFCRLESSYYSNQAYYRHKCQLMMCCTYWTALLSVEVRECKKSSAVPCWREREWLSLPLRGRLRQASQTHLPRTGQAQEYCIAWRLCCIAVKIIITDASVAVCWVYTDNLLTRIRSSLS